MTSKIFKACPLKSEDGVVAIRLLRLGPSTDPFQPVAGSLYSTTLDAAAGTYCALSYCWGDSTTNWSMFLEAESGDDKVWDQVPITRNLGDALADIRNYDTTQERTVWVDALCINQADNAEKAAQMRHMFAIYQHANGVVAHLGRDARGLEPAVAHVDYLRRHTPRPNAQNTGQTVVWHPKKGVLRRQAALRGTPGCETLFVTTATLPATFPCADPQAPRARPRWRDELASLHEIGSSWAIFFSLPWFSRAWTTLEFAASHNVTLQVGREVVVFTRHDLVLLVNSCNPPRRAVPTGTRTRPTRAVIRDHIYPCAGYSKLTWMLNLNDERPSSIGGVLANFTAEGWEGSIKASDSRDRLWAMLGLARASDSTSPLLQPDYGLDDKEVYLRFSRHIALTEGMVNLLRVAPHISPHMPSWALGDGSMLTPGQRLTHPQAILPRTAISGHLAEGKPTFRADGTQICVPAVLADQIEWVSPLRPVGLDFKAEGSLHEIVTLLSPLLRATREAVTSSPGSFFEFPPETEWRATVDFLRGVTFHCDPSSEYNPATGIARYDSKWDTYLGPYVTSARLAIDITASKGTAQERSYKELEDSPFFITVREHGWPADLVGRSGRVPPKARGKEISLTDARKDCGSSLLQRLQFFGEVLWWYYGRSLEGWQFRKVGRGEKGYLCNLDPRARVGDYLALMESSTTVILRRNGDGTFKIVGHAYVHRLQEGVKIFGQTVENIWIS
ncbi:hypothetical protein OQA88_9359 [Cercophora sp. LCS_1]